MIKIPKKQLSSLFLFPLSFLFLLLVFLFALTLRGNHALFAVLGLSQLLALIFLLFLRQGLVKKQTEAEMRRQNFLEMVNLLEAEIEKEKSTAQAIQEKTVNYAQLKDLVENLSMSLTLDDTSQVLSSEVNRRLGGGETTTILYLFQSKTGELGLLSSQKGRMRVNIKTKKGDIFDEWMIKVLQPLLIEDSKSDFRFDMDKAGLEESRVVRSLISVPLAIGNKTLGILRVDSPQEGYFKTEDLRLLMTIGDLGAMAIENAQLYERVEELAIKDGLTGLYLKHYLLTRMNEEVTRELRSKKELSFLMIDLDKFKDYNDKYGHVAGDIVLRVTGMILLEVFKHPGNLVARYGGEEFAILLPDCSKEKALVLAEEARKRIQKQEIILRKEKTSMTISIGVATFPVDAQVRDELIQVADKAMYQAKAQGRNRVCPF